jgi:hypothetical protein
VTTHASPDDSGATEHLRETQTGRRIIYEGRLLTFYEDDVRLADGTRAQREVVAHPGAVAIVAIDEAGKVVLVRQSFRPALATPARPRVEPPSASSPKRPACAQRASSRLPRRR